MREVLITQYAPDVENAVVSLFKELDDPDQYTHDISKSVQMGQINRDVSFPKVERYVEQFDKEQAIHTNIPPQPKGTKRLLKPFS